MRRYRVMSVLCVLLAMQPVAGRAELAYVAALPDDVATIVIDTRPQARCFAESLAGARCLPPEDFFGPHGRLANIRDIAWVFGTAGLNGAESVLVAGDDARRRDVIAALLFLSGQAQVQVLNTSFSNLLADTVRPVGPGRSRGMVRDPIYQAQAREALWLLRDELVDQLHRSDTPRILDGRPSPAYWGETVRARRGGHLPGAELAPAGDLRSALAAGRRELQAGATVIAYAHDPYSGLAYLTLLRAGLGVDARLYTNGWREWAEDGRLPIEAATYADRTRPAVQPASERRIGLQLLIILLAVLCAAGFGFIFGRRTS